MPDSAGATPFRLRSYQTEMVEESMKRNILVVMDTGSGKTLIAIERTRAQLETCPPDQLVWFIAPTVTLCEQQHEVFEKHLPGYSVQTLSGNDNVDRWSTKHEWDTVLFNVRIVISTPRVLLDALSHAFVKMSTIGLLIFDEAHHVNLKHPANLIMTDFYHPQLEAGSDELPRILGLSASPSIKAQSAVQTLKEVERNLDAVTRTPKLHRTELLQYVHKPKLQLVSYLSGSISEGPQSLLSALEAAVLGYDLHKDPFVVKLLAEQARGRDVSNQLQKAFLQAKTYCSEQLKTLLAKAQAMSEEIGPSAAEWYLCQCKAQFEKSCGNATNQSFGDWSGAEKKHLLGILNNLPFPPEPPPPSFMLNRLSRKIEVLIDTLVVEVAEDREFTGLIFIEQRAWVAAMAEIISNHPRTKSLFRVGTFVGTSQNTKRKTVIAAMAEPRNQQNTLDNFRAGQINLILATSVLEEGIDVSSCHLVICFEAPKNLKSFVQRRGRARRQRSKYMIFSPVDKFQRTPESWQKLEAEMVEAYLDDMRAVKEANTREKQFEESNRYFKVDSTGALLTLENAYQHLQHFCAKLTTDPYVDSRPRFRFDIISPDEISAEVTLPISVDQILRTATSESVWRTERMARSDAAFVAYKALHHAGLVNDNLLPSHDEDEASMKGDQLPENRPAYIPVSVAFDPWVEAAHCQQTASQTYFQSLVQLTTNDSNDTIQLSIFTPISLPMIPKFLLHWNNSKQYHIRVSPVKCATLPSETIRLMRAITRAILSSVHHGRMEDAGVDFIYLIVPCDADGEVLDQASLKDWLKSTTGHQSASSITFQSPESGTEIGLVLHDNGKKYLFRSIAEPDSPESTPMLLATRFPNRRTFLSPPWNDGNKNDSYTRVEELPAAECIITHFPSKYAIFALLFPSILRKLELYILADKLRSTILKPIGFSEEHLDIVLTAVTTSAADDLTNYQRHEFLGDCILKYVVSAHLMATHTSWPESYLTATKSKMVSNGTLARATLSLGLDAYIVFDKFTGKKWAPRYTHDVLDKSSSTEKTPRSSKIAADVIESLIGAAYVTGGLPRAHLAIKTLLPTEEWYTPAEASTILHDTYPRDVTLTGLTTLETLIGHTFTVKHLLLDALTHASFTGTNTRSSYERLEYLGDAVLDLIITTRLHAHEPALSHRTMHTLRTAAVNASFLVFCMFEMTLGEESVNKTTLEKEVHHRALWQFLRSSGFHIQISRDDAAVQHTQIREQILAALETDARYPWHLFALLDPPKFLSDIIESVIGAVYVDTQGDLGACEAFVERLGIIRFLDRAMGEGVDCLHPKERLGHLAVQREVVYVPVPVVDGGGAVQEAMERTGKGHKCQVRLDGEDVGGVVEGVNKLNAETIAAYRAIAILERDGGTRLPKRHKIA